MHGVQEKQTEVNYNIYSSYKIELLGSSLTSVITSTPDVRKQFTTYSGNLLQIVTTISSSLPASRFVPMPCRVTETHNIKFQNADSLIADSLTSKTDVQKKEGH